MSSSSELWASFPHDPRDPSVASLRASDADRDIVHGVLGDAFADGRLDRAEYDERSAAVLAARTLGELPALVADLVPDRSLVLSERVPIEAASSADLQARALESWKEDRRGAFVAFLGSAVVTWTIWAVFMLGGFPWPLIVNAMALLNFMRVAANRRELVAEEVKRLERKRAKKLRAQLEQPRPIEHDEDQ
jgi:hypothetical protein